MTETLTSKPNLLVLDDFEGELAAAPAMARLRSLANVTILDRPVSPAGYSELAPYQIVFALRERTTIDSDFLDLFPNLKLILQSGGHAYHLDRDAATARGILVALGRGAKRPMIVIPELTFALILGLSRQLYQAQQLMTDGQWPEMLGQSIHGKTLGILGYGRHGKPVGKIARAFGMKILAWDRGCDYTQDEPDVTRLPIEELMERSDIVSIHLRLSKESQGLVTSDLLRRMKSSALFINTARGAIVDEAALVQTLERGGIAGAGLDVFIHEPLAANSTLRSLPNVLLTPHIGWKVSALLHEWVEIAAGQLQSFLEGSLDPAALLNPESGR